MEEKNNKQPKVIDLRIVFKKIGERKKLFLKVLPVVFVLSCIYILSIPRYYSSDTKLAPETEVPSTGGALSSIASSFGFNLNNIQSSDAITPLLYPDLMDDNGFVTGLFHIKVKSIDGDINTTYYDYLKNNQKEAWWSSVTTGVTEAIKSLLSSDDIKGGAAQFDAYQLSQADDVIVGKIRKNVNIAIDKKTAVISIMVTAQDPLICKTIADSVQTRLQRHITEYRTNKARIDYEYYKQLTTEAKQDYERLRQRYGAFADGNVNIAMQSVRLKAEEMESEMELKLNNYNTLNNQMQAAKAKIQERTPAFTIIKGAAVPLKPAGPKRMIFVAGMLFLACIIISFYAIKDLIFKE